VIIDLLLVHACFELISTSVHEASRSVSFATGSLQINFQHGVELVKWFWSTTNPLRPTAYRVSVRLASLPPCGDGDVPSSFAPKTGGSRFDEDYLENIGRVEVSDVLLRMRAVQALMASRKLAASSQVPKYVPFFCLGCFDKPISFEYIYLLITNPFLHTVLKKERKKKGRKENIHHSKLY
jgi:hypothetical protein